MYSENYAKEIPYANELDAVCRKMDDLRDFWV